MVTLKTFTRVLDSDLQTIYGVISAGSEIQVYSNGDLASFVIENDTLINGYLFKADTNIILSPTGKFIQGTLARNEIAVLNEHTFEFEKLTNLAFWENSSIAGGEITTIVKLNEPYNFEIQKGRVAFDLHGRLVYGVLNTEITLTNTRSPIERFTLSLKTNATIQLYSDNNVENNQSINVGTLKTDLVWNNFVLKDSSTIGFYTGDSMIDVGEIRVFTMKYDTYRENFLIQAGQIILYKDGALKSFKLQGEKLINNLSLPKDSYLTLFQSGKLMHLICPNDITIQGNLYPANTKISFKENGDVIN
ncbi:hypothetical protein [Wenyingzhuangia sp. IMCC45574]